MVEGNKGIMLEDAKEHSDSEKVVDVGGDELGADVDALEAAGEDLRAVIEELHAGCEEVMVIVNEGISPGADEGFLLVTGEGFGPNAAQRLETMVEKDLRLMLLKGLCYSRINNNSDEECGQDIEVEDYALEEYEVKGRDGKVEGHESDYLDSSDPGKYGDSDESAEEICGTYSGKKTLGPRYDIKCAIPTWEVGLRFEDNIQFKEAVKKYSVANGVKLKFVKNEPKRTRVHCRETCPWKLYASYDTRYDCYVVKTYNSEHMCFRNKKSTMLSCKMIQKHFRDIILMNPKMKVATLKEMCQTELGHMHLRHVSKSSKGDSQGDARFLCRRVCKSMGGWKSGCRPFIGIDGCFLKSVSKGVLLVAIGRDGNNQMFPVAWAIVEREGKESWGWFLQKLTVDLNYPHGEGLTLMSDMQKILMNNYKKLESLGVNSSNDLLETLVECWSKAYFKGTLKCDVVDNNMAEAFNGWILEARCNPIITMLEEIRTMVMNRMNVKRTWAEIWRTNISPKALQKLERNMENSSQYRLVWNGDGGFEVNHLGNQHTVDLKKWTCTCRE
ncbi:hypothetical protein V6N13_118317 [Hibiscus sabdariffa]